MIKRDVRYLYPDNIGYIELIDKMGVDKRVVDSARVSFNKDNHTIETVTDKDVKLIKYLADNKHTSPFEHCTMTFRVKVPLVVARQHMRHRTWSYNEVSRRYTSDNIQFYSPKKFRKQHKSSRQASVQQMVDPVLSAVEGTTATYTQRASEVVENIFALSLKLYQDLIEKGVCREQARLVLPQSMYTEYWCTANLLNIVKFLKLRLPEESQWEIRRLAEEMSQVVKDHFPEAYRACLNPDLN